MSVDLSQWILGIVSGILVTLLGRYAYDYLSKKVSKRPVLRWFRLADFEAPSEKGIFSEAYELSIAASEGDPERYR